MPSAGSRRKPIFARHWANKLGLQDPQKALYYWCAGWNKISVRESARRVRPALLENIKQGLVSGDHNVRVEKVREELVVAGRTGVTFRKLWAKKWAHRIHCLGIARLSAKWSQNSTHAALASRPHTFALDFIGDSKYASKASRYRLCSD